VVGQQRAKEGKRRRQEGDLFFPSLCSLSLFVKIKTLRAARFAGLFPRFKKGEINKEKKREREEDKKGIFPFLPLSLFSFSLC
jgi:hypothetical protein